MQGLLIGRLQLRFEAFRFSVTDLDKLIIIGFSVTLTRRTLFVSEGNEIVTLRIHDLLRLGAYVLADYCYVYNSIELFNIALFCSTMVTIRTGPGKVAYLGLLTLSFCSSNSKH